MLDNVHYFGHNPGMPDSGRYCGRIGEQQLQFVRNVLANVPLEQLVVVSLHIPLRNYQNPSSAADNTIDHRALLELLSSRPHTVSFSGHMHLTEHHYFGADDGFHGAKPHHHHVLTAACGGWWGGPKDSRGIPSADSQDGNAERLSRARRRGLACTTRFVPAAGKSRAQLRAVVDGPHCRDAQTKPHGHGAGATPARAPFPVRADRECVRRGPSDARELRDRGRRRRNPLPWIAPRSATLLSRGYLQSMQRRKSRGCARCLPHMYGKRPFPGTSSPARIALPSRPKTNTAGGTMRISSWKSRTPADRASDGSRRFFSGKVRLPSRVKPR